MDTEKITIDQTLLAGIVQTLGRAPENFHDFQKIKDLSCRAMASGQSAAYHAPLPQRLEIVSGDFSAVGKMSRLKKLTLSGVKVNDFSFLTTCTALESLEISDCGIFDCAFLDNLTGLKNLSLLRCPALAHMENILKLFRLTRLSLEGTMIQDGECFKNCPIPEIHLPEHLLNQQKRSHADSGAEKNAQDKTGAPFQAARRNPGQYPYTLTSLDSPLWESYRGAYGDVREYLSAVTGERKEAPELLKLRRMERAPKTNYEIAFDNLCETLWHQMSFYPATWLTLPWLASLMEAWEKEGDLEWCFRGITAAGSCLATDVHGNRPEDESVCESYENAAKQIRLIAMDFIAAHMDYIQEKDIWQKREFATAAAAILGERRLAFMLFLSSFDSCYIICPDCENCDEEIEFGCFDPAERIEAAKVPEETWDGKSLEKTELWLFNLFALLGDKEGEEYLRYCFGTYECPECGKKMQTLTGMEEYYLGE